MRASIAILIVSAIAVSACGNDPSAVGNQATMTDSAVQADASADSRSQATSSAGSGSEHSRNDFVLCPALDEYREELGALVGIPQNTDPIKDTAGRFMCILHGVEQGDQLTVEVMPAFLTVNQLQPDNFDAPASRVPELGEHGWYVSDDYLRRTYFTMGSLILTVEAVSTPRPDKSQMVAVSKRVNDILAEANP